MLHWKTWKNSIEKLKKAHRKVAFNSIEVILLYSDSVEAASGPLRDPAAEAKFSPPQKDAATFQHLSALQGRHPSEGVRLNGKMEGEGFEPSKT